MQWPQSGLSDLQERWIIRPLLPHNTTASVDMHLGIGLDVMLRAGELPGQLKIQAMCPKKSRSRFQLAT